MISGSLKLMGHCGHQLMGLLLLVLLLGHFLPIPAPAPRSHAAGRARAPGLVLGFARTSTGVQNDTSQGPLGFLLGPPCGSLGAFSELVWSP